ncbi:MAG: helix-turn-helix domain-containing protein [Actinomycetota bacterium]
MKRKAIEIDPEDRAELERRMRSRYTSPRERVRCLAVLLAAEGLSDVEIERRSGLGRDHVATWRRRFVEQGLRGLEEKPRSGRPKTFGADVRQAIARLVAGAAPGGRTWTLRSLADAVVAQVGVSISRSQVRRILIELGLHPVRE